MFSESGVPVHIVLSTAGFPTAVPPGGKLQLTGLPRGTYRIAIGGAQTVTQVERGKETPVSLR
jgi:hypothetical protein